MNIQYNGNDMMTSNNQTATIDYVNGQIALADNEALAYRDGDSGSGDGDNGASGDSTDGGWASGGALAPRRPFEHSIIHQAMSVATHDRLRGGRVPIGESESVPVGESGCEYVIPARPIISPGMVDQLSHPQNSTFEINIKDNINQQLDGIQQRLIWYEHREIHTGINKPPVDSRPLATRRLEAINNNNKQ